MMTLAVMNCIQNDTGHSKFKTKLSMVSEVKGGGGGVKVF
jgi:hypothetical protein